MSSDKLAKLDQFISDLRRTLNDAEKVREILATNPSLADLLVGSLSAPTMTASASSRPAAHTGVVNEPQSPNGIPHVSGGPTTLRYFEAIKKCLLDGNNAWQTVNEITTGAGIPHHAVTHVLYRTHKVLFERSTPLEGGREKVWRLIGVQSPADVEKAKKMGFFDEKEPTS
jgi:hypothetical protein